MKPSKWKEIRCWDCDGYGQVSDYGIGDDFYGAMECRTCDGSGSLSKHESGAVAKYPGGPFVGSEKHGSRNY